MTPQEAIEIIKDPNRHYRAKADGAYEYTEFVEALETAKQALEKQIPKKVTTHTAQENCKIGARTIRAGSQINKCPICKSFISKINKHCGNCGQALDWSNDK